jgi:MFS family permease
MHPARLHVLFQFLFGLGLGCNFLIYVPNLLRIGLTLADIALVNAIFFAAIVVLELPTGMLADGKSRAWSVKAGAFTWTLAAACYVAASGFWSALACEILAGVGAAFMSGAQEAWLTDALDKRGERHSLKKTFANAGAASAVGVIIGGISGGLLGWIDLRLGWVASAIIVGGGALLLFLRMDDSGEPIARVSELEALRRSVHAVRSGSGLVFALLCSASLGLVLSFNHYWVPFFTAKTGQTGVTILWAPMYGAMAFGSAFARRMPTRPWCIAITIAVVGLTLAAMGLCAGTVTLCAMLIVHEVARGLIGPQLSTYVQARIESEHRATFGSLQSFVGKMGWTAVLLCVWLATTGKPTTTAVISAIWAVNGALLTVIALGMTVYAYAKHRPAAHCQKPDIVL